MSKKAPKKTAPKKQAIAAPVENRSLENVRGQFSGVTESVASLPDGEHKTTIMSRLAEAYLSIAETFLRWGGPVGA